MEALFETVTNCKAICCKRCQTDTVFVSSTPRYNQFHVLHINSKVKLMYSYIFISIFYKKYKSQE